MGKGAKLRLVTSIFFFSTHSDIPLWGKKENNVGDFVNKIHSRSSLLLNRPSFQYPEESQCKLCPFSSRILKQLTPFYNVPTFRSLSENAFNLDNL